MKNVKYFLFSLLCMVCSCVVFAKDEITIDKMIPVYDENSGVIVSEENGVHSVVFNDKDQNVKYNIILKNNTKRDISLKDIVLPESPEEFFKYELVGLDEDTVLEPNSTEEVVLSLETVKTEGWGRNFTLDLTSKVEIMDNVVNPNTSAQELIVLFVSITSIICIVIICLKNKKVPRYVVLVVMFGSLMSVTHAKDPIILPIKLNISYESQNVMKATTCSWEYDGWGGYYLSNCGDYWNYASRIVNFFVENEKIDLNEYTYKFDVSEKQDGKVIAYLVTNAGNNEKYDLHLQADGIIYANENASYYFSGMSFDKIYNLESFDMSNVTDMSYMFYDFGLMNDVVNLDLNSFDTSNVTNMSNMFENLGMYSEEIILNINQWDTSNVLDMSYMFRNVGYKAITFDVDVSGFDTSKVTDMSYMFCGFGVVTEKLKLDVSNFDTSNVIDMSGMFAGVGEKAKNFTLDLSNFNTSNVTNMDFMFASIAENVEEFTLDLSSFDTSKVTNMSRMFMASAMQSSKFILDINSFDTSNVTNMSQMFYMVAMNSEIFSLDVSNFDTSKVTNMESMFYNAATKCLSFDLDVSKFDTSNVTNMKSMFYKTGFDSTIFNVTLTIRNLNTKYYSSMFTEVATKTGSKVTVNYTNETEALVDKMIATKSSNSNVVKGVQVD